MVFRTFCCTASLVISAFGAGLFGSTGVVRAAICTRSCTATFSVPACLRLRLRFSRSSSRASPANDLTPVGETVGRFILPNTFGPDRVSNLVSIFCTSSSAVSASGATGAIAGATTVSTTGAAGVSTTGAGAATSTATTGAAGASITGATSMGFSTTTGSATTSLTGVSTFTGGVSTVFFFPMSIFPKIFGPANSSNFEAIFS